jgi:hypothetical protein
VTASQEVSEILFPLPQGQNIIFSIMSEAIVSTTDEKMPSKYACECPFQIISLKNFNKCITSKEWSARHDLISLNNCELTLFFCVTFSVHDSANLRTLQPLPKKGGSLGHDLTNYCSEINGQSSISHSMFFHYIFSPCILQYNSLNFIL